MSAECVNRSMCNKKQHPPPPALQKSNQNEKLSSSTKKRSSSPGQLWAVVQLCLLFYFPPAFDVFTLYSEIALAVVLAIMQKMTDGEGNART